MTRDQKGAPAALDLLSLEVRTEALLGWVKRSELGVERGDQAVGICRVKWLGGNGQAGVAHAHSAATLNRLSYDSGRNRSPKFRCPGTAPSGR